MVMADRLANKTALITGGNSGIGLATARLFVAEGAKVTITGRNKETLDAAAKEMRSNALAVVADANDAVATEAAVKKAAETFGKLDIVFANAGIPGDTPVGKTALGAFEQVIRTNITSVFFTVQAALPYLNDGASIILNGSVISVLGNPGYSAYAASKAGVRAMARVMASELSPRGIRVNVVAPGAAKTPIWNGAAPTADAFAALEKRIELSTPPARMADADHIAKTVLFLASDDSAHVQSVEIFVDGGSTGSPAGAPIYRAGQNPLKSFPPGQPWREAKAQVSDTSPPPWRSSFPASSSSSRTVRTTEGVVSDKRIRSSIDTGLGPNRPMMRARSSASRSGAGGLLSLSSRGMLSGRAMIGSPAWITSEAPAPTA